MTREHELDLAEPAAVLELNKIEVNNPTDRMLQWFQSGHLPENLQAVACVFENVAHDLVANVHPGPERTVALRKLLEAKDAAVRAALTPGG